MRFATGLGALFVVLGTTAFAQDTQDVPEISDRKVSHYVGIQANQLIRQILSLGNPGTVINNPYLVVYTVTDNLTGVGLNLGLGYTFNEFKDNDGTTQRETSLNELAFRIGIEKKSSLGKRWILAAGGDFVVENLSNKTKTFSAFGGGGASTVQTNNTTSGGGLGLRAALLFRVTEKIYFGTEANYYLKFLKEKSSLTSSFGGSEKSETNFKRFQLNVPAVLFLTLKL